jgi:hypothetical protein
MIEQTVYHKVLRVSAAVCAFVLLFESGLVDESTRTLSQNAHQYVANTVGVGASVRPNELNQLTAELTEQRQLLNEREAALREREIEVELATGGNTNQQSTYLVAALLFILLVLIVTNYILDYLRAQRREVVPSQVPVQ